jgi:glycerol kinase
MFGTVDTYLIYNLTEEKNHFTDITNASRTSLYNIEAEQWDEELLELFDIPKQILPTVCDCDANFGTIKIGSRMVAITGVIGDQQSALVGQRCFESGTNEINLRNRLLSNG